MFQSMFRQILRSSFQVSRRALNPNNMVLWIAAMSQHAQLHVPPRRNSNIPSSFPSYPRVGMNLAEYRYIDEIFHSTQSRIRINEEAIDSLRQENNLLESKCRGLEDENKKLKAEQENHEITKREYIPTKRIFFAAMMEMTLKSKSDKEKLEAMIKDLRAQLAQTQFGFETKLKEKEDLLSLSKQRTECLEIHLKELKNEIETLKCNHLQVLSEKDEGLKEMQKLIQESIGTNSKLKLHNEKLGLNINELKQMQSEFDNRLKKKEESLILFELKNEQLESQLKELTKRIEPLKEELKLKEKDLAEMFEMNKELKSHNEVLEARKNNLIDDLDRKFSYFNHELKANQIFFKSQIKELENEIKTLKEELKEKEKVLAGMI